MIVLLHDKTFNTSEVCVKTQIKERENTDLINKIFFLFVD